MICGNKMALGGDLKKHRATVPGGNQVSALSDEDCFYLWRILIFSTETQLAVFQKEKNVIGNTHTMVYNPTLHL